MRNKAMNSSVQEEKPAVLAYTQDTTGAHKWKIEPRDRAGTENSTKNPSGSKSAGAESTVGTKTSGRHDLRASPMGEPSALLGVSPCSGKQQTRLGHES
jgi:hypothetical protein